MYYYITEPLITSAERKRIEDIKTILAQLGIAGEFAIASPARTVEEHLELAFKKGFTTIVGIGSDALANTVASTMIKYTYDKGVFGFIPFSNKQQLWQMIGAHSLRDHCQTLRTRMLISVDAVELNKDYSFITQADMALAKPIRFRLNYRQLDIMGQCTNLSVNTDGHIQIWDNTYQSPFASKGTFFSRLMGSHEDTSMLSLTSIIADRWQFETETPSPILVNGAVATQTPLDATRRPKALKLIVNRAKITPDS